MGFSWPIFKKVTSERFAALNAIYKSKFSCSCFTLGLIMNDIKLYNMFPVPSGLYHYVNISDEKDINYRALLLAEYRYIKSIQDKIRKNALNLYKHKINNGTNTALSKRCNDFTLLEKEYKNYVL